MTRLNVKPLIILAVTVIVLGLGAYGAWYVQMRWHAKKLWVQANASWQKGDWPRATRLLEQYLRYRPKSTYALAQYAVALSEQVRTADEAKAAAIVVDRTLIRAPGREDIRRQAMRLALLLGRFPDAREHAQVLARAHPDDAHVEFTFGRCEEADGKFAEAASWYEKSIAQDPKGIESFIRLALLARHQLKDPPRADKLMDTLVTANPQMAAAYLSRAEYRIEFQPQARDQTRADVIRALELEPDNAEALLLASTLASERAEYGQARGFLERLLAKNPQNPGIYGRLAEVEVRAGQPDQAEQRLAAGLKAVPHNLYLLALQVGLWINRSQLDQVPANLQQLRDLGYDRGRLGLLEARYQIARLRWSEAIKSLEGAIPLLVQAPEAAQQANLLLASCYERVGNTERQIDALQRIARSDAGGPPAHAQYATALESRGRYDEALAEYTLIPDPSPEIRLGVARVLLARNLLRPLSRRSWNEVEAALDTAAKAAPESPLVPIARAQMLVAQGRADDAYTLLEHARDAHPKQPELWTALIALADLRGQAEAISPLLDQAQAALGDSVEVRLLRARELAVRGGADRKNRILQLSQNLGQFPPEDSRRLREGLVSAFLLMDDPADALALWSGLASEQPRDPNVQFLMFDVALQARDTRSQDQAIQRLRDIEGSNGFLWRYAMARQRILQARAGDTAALAAARTLLAQIADLQPNWSRVPLLQAEIDELQGRSQEAMSQYLSAIDLGVRDLNVLRRTLQLLTENHRFDEANQILGRVQDQPLLFGALRRMSSELSFANRDPARPRSWPRRPWIVVPRTIAITSGWPSFSLRRASGARSRNCCGRPSNRPVLTPPPRWLSCSS